MSPGLVRAGTGGGAGPAECWLAWTTTALSRSGTCGGATAARAAGSLMRSGGSPSRCAAGSSSRCWAPTGREDLHDGGAGGTGPPSPGRVRVLGCDPCRERALVRRRMGIMLQEGGFPPDLTVAVTGRMRAGTLSAPRPVAEALGLVSLGHRAGVAVRSLSGGERRRLD